MKTTLKRLHAGEGPGIPVHVGVHEDRTLVECRDAAAFLARLGALPPEATLPADSCVRGVLTSDGAVFELLDPFGRASDEVLRLGADDARALLREIW